MIVTGTILPLAVVVRAGSVLGRGCGEGDDDGGGISGSDGEDKGTGKATSSGGSSSSSSSSLGRCMLAIYCVEAGCVCVQFEVL